MKTLVGRLGISAAIIFVMLGVAFFSATLSFTYKSDTLDAIDHVSKATVRIGISSRTNPKIVTIGGGVIVSERGYVLTVKHNVTNADHIFIQTREGDTFKVSHYIADAHRDLALLLVDNSEVLTSASIGSDRTLRVGQTVFAVGYPSSSFIYDKYPSVSRGIVGALNRVITPATRSESDSENELSWGISYTNLPPGRRFIAIPVTSLIQTDAAVNPGSSGGPLVDEEGKIVGIVQSMISNTGSNVGMNFAIPISEASLLLKAAGIEGVN